MALAANSYGTVKELVAVTRRFLDGKPTFDTETRPTLDDVETFIDRTSQVLNDALAAVGFTVPITGNQALSCDDWVIAKAAEWVEMTSPYSGFDGTPGGRNFSNLHGDAMSFAESVKKSWQNQGVAVTTPAHEGLTFTALNKHSERTDPDSTTLEQPMFRRGQFDP